MRVSALHARWRPGAAPLRRDRGAEAPLAASVRMSDAPATAGGIDWAETAKYPLATAAQAGLIATFFRAVDACGQLPAPLVPPLFAFLSLRSRLFSPLPANRPPRGGFEVDGKRVPTPGRDVRPWWTPPGIAPHLADDHRAARRLLDARLQGGVRFSGRLLLLGLHLAVGDTWNSVTNVEQRRVSAVGVIFVWCSVVAAVKAFYAVAPLAGAILALGRVDPIASVLTWTIWKINPPLEPLLPQRGDGLGVSGDSAGLPPRGAVVIAPPAGLPKKAAAAEAKEEVSGG